MQRLLPFLALGAALVLATSCRAGRESDAPATPPNIVLITIDTLRADRIGRGFTPAIDGLAATGVRFDNARTSVPLTLPSHVSIMTGQLPVAHGVRDNGVVFAPQASAPTIARRLRDAGYRTGAFVGAYVLDRRFGLVDGFDTYDDRFRRQPGEGARLEAERPGGEVVDAAVAWLNQTTSRFFLWVHLYDPACALRARRRDIREKAGGNAYDGEVAYADAQVARLVELLRARGVLASTAIVVTGDHGEGLGDHGEHAHGMLAYDSTLKVPLVVLGRGRAQARCNGTGVARRSRADVVASGRSHDRRAERRSRSRRQLAERDVYAETQYPRAAGWHALSVLAGERWKLIQSSETELYDLSSDPGEQRNVAAAHAGVVQGMTARLTALQSVSPAPTAAVAAEASERLRALGYVSGAAAPAGIDRTRAEPRSRD